MFDVQSFAVAARLNDTTFVAVTPYSSPGSWVTAVAAGSVAIANDTMVSAGASGETAGRSAVAAPAARSIEYAPMTPSTVRNATPELTPAASVTMSKPPLAVASRPRPPMPLVAPSFGGL